MYMDLSTFAIHYACTRIDLTTLTLPYICTWVQQRIHYTTLVPSWDVRMCMVPNMCTRYKLQCLAFHLAAHGGLRDDHHVAACLHDVLACSRHGYREDRLAYMYGDPIPAFMHYTTVL